MPILRNARHERFAQELAAGKTASEAYVLAGYKPNTGNAAALKGKQRISKRVDEILAKRERVEQEGLQRAIERSAISKERVLEELAKIGFANMSDYMRVGPDGNPVLDFSALTRDQAAALVEVTVEDFKDGRGEAARVVRRVKFKLADKRGALVDLGRHLGLFVDRHEHRGDPSGSTSLTVEERDRLAQKQLEEFWGPVLELEAQELAEEAEQERQDQLRAGGAPYEQTDPTH